jgi:hypothetical protein
MQIKGSKYTIFDTHQRLASSTFMSGGVYIDWEEFAAAQDIESRGEATGDTTTAGEDHLWEAGPYAVNLEEPNRQDWTRA